MEKIPSAEELLKRINPDCVEDCHKAMIEFAKLHVKEALKEASEKAEAYHIDDAGQTIYTDAKIDKKSILNSYPLDLVK